MCAAEFRGAVPGEGQVEPAQDRAIPGGEHVEAGVLLSQQGAVSLGELAKELLSWYGGRELRWLGWNWPEMLAA